MGTEGAEIWVAQDYWGRAGRRYQLYDCIVARETILCERKMCVEHENIDVFVLSCRFIKK